MWCETIAFLPSASARNFCSYPEDVEMPLLMALFCYKFGPQCLFTAGLGKARLFLECMSLSHFCYNHETFLDCKTFEIKIC